MQLPTGTKLILALLIAATLGCVGEPFTAPPTIPPTIEGAFGTGTYRQLTYGERTLPTGFDPATPDETGCALASDSARLVLRPGVIVWDFYQRQWCAGEEVEAVASRFAQTIFQWTETGFRTTEPDPGPCGGYQNPCFDRGMTFGLEVRGDTMDLIMNEWGWVRRDRFVRIAP